MKILALDIATTVGVCVGTAGQMPTAWSVNLGPAPEDRRFSAILLLTHNLLAEHKPDLVAYEAPIGGPKTSHYLVGLAACVKGCVANRGVPLVSCNLAAVRKHFTGRTWNVKDFPHLSRTAAKQAIKSQVVARCKLLKWDVKDHDAADAAAVWDFACATKAGVQAAPSGELFR